MDSSARFHIRPEWVGPRRGLVTDFLNIFAPREENVVWAILVRDFPRRLWGFWTSVLIAVLPISYVVLWPLAATSQFVFMDYAIKGFIVYNFGVLGHYLVAQSSGI